MAIKLVLNIYSIDCDSIARINNFYECDFDWIDKLHVLLVITPEDQWLAISRD